MFSNRNHKDEMLQRTSVVPLHRSDGNGLQSLLQEVQQTGTDDHFLRQGLQRHPGVQLGRLHSSTAFTFGCKDTRDFQRYAAQTANF